MVKQSPEDEIEQRKLARCNSLAFHDSIMWFYPDVLILVHNHLEISVQVSILGRDTIINFLIIG
jgi:hypothetical protein